MLQNINKETHVFLKTDDSFTSISKRKMKGLHQVFTTIKLTSQMADQINELYGANLEVERINYAKGFLLIRLKKNSSYKHIVKAIKSVMYSQS